MKIGTIIVADRGAGQNFISKLVAEAKGLDYIIEDWPMNEFSVRNKEGFGFDYFPFEDEVTQNNIDIFKNGPDLGLIKTPFLPNRTFEVIDIDYDEMIIVDPVESWFYKLLLNVKHRTAGIEMPNQYRMYKVLKDHSIWCNECFRKGIDPETLTDKLNNYIRNFNHPLFHKYSPFVLNAARYEALGYNGFQYEFERILNSITPDEKIEGEYKNCFRVSYPEFFFDLDIPDWMDKEAVRTYSLENIKLVKDFLNLYPGNEQWKRKLDYWKDGLATS